MLWKVLILLSKCGFSRMFHTERAWHIYLYISIDCSYCFLVGRICPLMQAHFLRPLLKRKAFLFRLNKGSNFLQSAFWIWSKRFSLVRECNVFLQCCITLGPARQFSLQNKTAVKQTPRERETLPCMSWPLSVKHAAKITFAQYKCGTFQSIIYPSDKNNFIGISSTLAWGKSRLGLPPPFFASKTRCLLLLRRNNDQPSCSSYKKSESNPRKNGTGTVPLWFLGGRLVCSAKMITTFLAIYRLPSIKVLFSCSWMHERMADTRG